MWSERLKGACLAGRHQCSLAKLPSSSQGLSHFAVIHHHLRRSKFVNLKAVLTPCQCQWLHRIERECIGYYASSSIGATQQRSHTPWQHHPLRAYYAPLICLSSLHLHDKAAYGDVESDSGGAGLSTHNARHHAADYALVGARCVAGACCLTHHLHHTIPISMSVLLGRGGAINMWCKRIGSRLK